MRPAAPSSSDHHSARPRPRPATLRQQVRALVVRNYILKRRRRFQTLQEIFYPIYFIVILVIIQRTVDNRFNNTFPAARFAPETVLPFNRSGTSIADEVEQLLGVEPPVFLCSPDDNATVAFMRAAVDRLASEIAPSTDTAVDADVGDGSNTSAVDLMEAEIVPLPSLESMDVWLREDDRARLLRGAVAFSASTADLIANVRASPEGATIPFTLRFNSSDVPSQTPVVLPSLTDCIGEINDDPSASVMFPRTACPPDGYVREGVVGLQMAVTTEFVARLRGNPDADGVDDTAPLDIRTNVLQIPTPELDVQTVNTQLDTVRPIYIALAFFPIVQYLLVSIVSEKEKGRKEYLHVLGTRNVVFWASWGIVYMSLIGIPVLLITIVSELSDLFPSLNGGLLFFLLLFFGSSLIAQAFALSSFFSVSRKAGAYGAILTSASSLLFFALRRASAPVEYVLSLLPPVAVTQGLNHAVMRQRDGADVSFGSAFQGDGFTIGGGILMLIFDTVLYAWLAWYLDQVVPNGIGVPRKWYFIFQRRMSSREIGSHVGYYDGISGADGINENGSLEKQPALVVDKLSKTFVARTRNRAFSGTTKTLINANQEISFDARDGEIVGLLGHNGAGKSTLINLLAGLIKPTGGSASVYSLSLENDLMGIRHLIGLVPQSNDVLYEELTCMEHMRLVGGIKGLARSDMDERAQSVLAEVGLGSDVYGQRAKTMSGGQQRKLCLAMALLGSPALLILDEHSTGVDVVARRDLWQLLKRHRGGRVTLVASHFLDEVENLCDRVVVLEKGRVLRNATPLRLKAEFNIAYKLHIVAPLRNHDEILAAVQQHVPPAIDLAADTSGEVFGVNGNREEATLRVSLPLESFEQFPAVFDALEGANGDRMGIVDIGLALPSLEEVFLKLETERDSPDTVSAISSDGTCDDHIVSDAEVENGGRSNINASRVRGSSALIDGAEALGIVREGPGMLDVEERGLESARSKRKRVDERRQIQAVLRLQLLGRSRERGYWFCALILPVVFLLAGLLLARSSANNLSDTSSDIEPVFLSDGIGPLSDTLDVDAEQFRTGLSILDASSDAEEVVRWADSIGDVFPTAVLDRDGGIESFQSFFEGRLEREDSLEGSVVPSAIVLSNISGDIVNPGLATGMTVNVFSNFTYVHELPTTCSRLSSALLRLATGSEDALFEIEMLAFESSELGFDLSSFFAGLLIVMAFASGPASYAIVVVQERVIGFDHALRMAGLGRRARWVSSFLADVFAAIVVAILSIIVIAAVNIRAFRGLALVPFVLGVLLYVTVMVLYSYVWSFAFTNVESVTNLYPTFLTMSAWLSFIVLFNVSVFASFRVTQILNAVILALLPQASLGSVVLFLIRFSAAQELGLVDGDITLRDYFSTNVLVYPALIAMFGHIFLLLGLLYFLDVVRYKGRLRRSRQAWFKHTQKHPVPDESSKWGDADVVGERERVRALFDKGDDITASSCHIAANDISVAYEQPKSLESSDASAASFRLAVNRVHLAVAEGQRVGLLGPNGAGKTSLMSVFTGELGASTGAAYAGGHNVQSSPFEAFREMGYTAQHNRLLDKISAREHMELFATLAGVERGEVKSVSDKVLRELRIEEHADKWSKALSGGTKRKLSLALGTMGSPSAQLHDEPSSGIDVFAQQKMREAVLERTHMSSAIISTHNMSEAAALCNQIVIMTNGHVRCIGTPQHLLRLYGQGFIVEVICAEAAVGAVGRFMRMLFPDAKVLDSFGGRIRFLVLHSEPHAEGAACDAVLATVLRWTDDDVLNSEWDVEDDITFAADVGESTRIKPSFTTVFKSFATIRAHLRIEDVAFSQPTLEQIFNRFAAEKKS